MIYKFLIAISILFFAILFQIHERGTTSVQQVYSSNEHLLAKREMSLENRYGNKFVNDVFKDNILLTLAYLSGKVQNPSKINWEQVKASSRYDVVLNPGDVFAYHDDVLSEYKG